MKEKIKSDCNLQHSVDKNKLYDFEIYENLYLTATQENIPFWKRNKINKNSKSKGK